LLCTAEELIERAALVAHRMLRRGRGIVDLGVNAIYLHGMHTPSYGGCVEMRKRRLPALSVLGREYWRVAQVLVNVAGAAGRGLGVVWSVELVF
jgi:hypothetical protein